MQKNKACSFLFFVCVLFPQDFFPIYTDTFSLNGLKCNVTSEDVDQCSSWIKKRLRSLFSFRHKKKHRDLLGAKLQRELIQEGYWDSVVKISGDKCDELVLDLGKKRILNSVSVRGSSDILLEEVKAYFLKLSKHCGLDPYKLDNCKSLVETFLHREGFWHSSVVLNAQQSFVSGDSEVPVDLRVYVDLKDQARFGPVSFISNECTYDLKLKDLVAIKPGSHWDSSSLLQTRKQLLSTGLFKEVRVVYSKQVQDLSCVPVSIFLQEESKNDFTLKAAFSLTGGLFYKQDFNFTCNDHVLFSTGLSFSRKNLFSLADKVDIDANFDLNTQSINLFYKRNDPIAYGCRSYLSAFASKSKCWFSDDEYKSVRNVGSYVNLNRGSVSSGYLNLITGYQAFQIKGFTPMQDRWTQYLSLEPSFSIDKIKGSWAKRHGFAGYFGIQGIFSMVDGFSNIAGAFSNFSWFMSLLPNCCIVLKMQAEGSNFFVRNDTTLIKVGNRSPYDENFRFAGSGSAEDCLFVDLADHLHLVNSVQDVWQVYQRGNYHRILFNCEARTALSEKMGLTVFANPVFDSYKNSNCFFGSGLRYNLSFGLMYFDVAWNLQKSCLNWRLALGENF